MDAVVEQIAKTSPGALRGVRIVCVQHLLETTGSLFEAFVRLGCAPENIHVLGKCYSTSSLIETRLEHAGYDVLGWQGVVERGRFTAAIRRNIGVLWSRVEALAKPGDRAMVVLDDGGRCRQFIPASFDTRRIVAVEQTTSGLKYRPSRRRVPTVEVAGSAAKRVLEPPAVTASIMRFIVPQLDRSGGGPVIGVIGLGTVGQDVARTLLNEGREVNVYDKDPTFRSMSAGAKWCDSLQKLFETLYCVLGCTGEDLLRGAGAWIGRLKGRRVLASCSSEDIEFRSLLQRAEPIDGHDPMGHVEIRLPAGSLSILRGGYPANFIGTKNSGPVALIQVTRALLLAGVCQAAKLSSIPPSDLPRRIMLDPELQTVTGRAFLTPGRKHWFGSGGEPVLDVNWVAAHSSGTRVLDTGAVDGKR